MKHIFKKSAAMLLAVIMAVIALPFSAQVSAQAAEQKPEPRVAVSMAFSNDLPPNIYGGDIIPVKVSWISVLGGTGEPVTITATNGAQIQTTGITFKANGTQAPITGLASQSNGGKVTFTTGTPAANPLTNEVTFNVKAPLNYTGAFTLGFKIGVEGAAENQGVNYVSKTFQVQPLISINAVYSTRITVNYGFIVPGYSIGGRINVPGASKAVISIVQRTGGASVYGGVHNVNNGGYDSDWISFEDLSTGYYDITVAALDNNYATIGTHTISVYFVKPYQVTYDVKLNLILSGFGVTVDTITQTYPAGSILFFPPGKIINNGFADYKILSATLNGVSLGSTGRVVVNGPMTINLTCQVLVDLS